MKHSRATVPVRPAATGQQPPIRRPAPMPRTLPTRSSISTSAGRKPFPCLAQVGSGIDDPARSPTLSSKISAEDGTSAAAGNASPAWQLARERHSPIASAAPTSGSGFMIVPAGMLGMVRDVVPFLFALAIAPVSKILLPGDDFPPRLAGCDGRSAPRREARP